MESSSEHSDSSSSVSEHLFSMYAVPEIFLNGFPGEEMSFDSARVPYTYVQKLDVALLSRWDSENLLLSFWHSDAMYRLRLDENYRVKESHLDWTLIVGHTGWCSNSPGKIRDQARKLLSWGACHKPQIKRRYITVTGEKNRSKMEKVLDNIREGFSQLIYRARYNQLGDMFSGSLSQMFLEHLLSVQIRSNKRNKESGKKYKDKMGIVALKVTPHDNITLAEEWDEIRVAF